MSRRLITYICTKVHCCSYAPSCLRTMVQFWLTLSSGHFENGNFLIGVLFTRSLLLSHKPSHVEFSLSLWSLFYMFKNTHVKSYKDLDVLFCEKKNCWAIVEQVTCFWDSPYCETGMGPSELPLHEGLRESSEKDRKATVKYKMPWKIRYYDANVQIWWNGGLVTHYIFLCNLVCFIVL